MAYTFAQLEQIWIRNGGNPASAKTAAAVALAESSGNPTNRYNPGPQEDSRGLWQINIVPTANPQYAGTDLYNPDLNAKAAIALSGNGANWHPWTTFTSGRYLSFLSSAAPAATVPTAAGSSTNPTTGAVAPAAGSTGGDLFNTQHTSQLLYATIWIGAIIAGAYLLWTGLNQSTHGTPARAAKHARDRLAGAAAA